MSDADFDERLARLIANLDETATLLRDHGETHWLRWVTKCRSELAKFNAVAFDHVLGSFGGSGSLNDLLILGANGHVVRPEEESAVNDRLRDLLRAIYE